jgi:hypothetical protein
MLFERLFLSKFTMLAQVLMNCLRYIFLQEMKFIWKVLLGSLVLFLFYISRLYFAEPLKELLEVYNQYSSIPDFEQVCLL